MLTMSLGRTSGTTLQHISLLWRLELLSLLPMVSSLTLFHRPCLCSSIIHIVCIGVAPPLLCCATERGLRHDQSSGSKTIAGNIILRNDLFSGLSYALLVRTKDFSFFLKTAFHQLIMQLQAVLSICNLSLCFLFDSIEIVSFLYDTCSMIDYADVLLLQVVHQIYAVERYQLPVHRNYPHNFHLYCLISNFKEIDGISSSLIIQSRKPLILICSYFWSLASMCLMVVYSSLFYQT